MNVFVLFVQEVQEMFWVEVTVKDDEVCLPELLATLLGCLRCCRSWVVPSFQMAHRHHRRGLRVVMELVVAGLAQIHEHLMAYVFRCSLSQAEQD